MMALPARHRDKAGKLYLPAIQRRGSDQMKNGLYFQLDERWGSGHRMRSKASTSRISRSAVHPSLLEHPLVGCAGQSTMDVGKICDQGIERA
jgi:hypothetical protein